MTEIWRLRCFLVLVQEINLLEARFTYSDLIPICSGASGVLVVGNIPFAILIFHPLT